MDFKSNPLYIQQKDAVSKYNVTKRILGNYIKNNQLVAYREKGGVYYNIEQLKKLLSFECKIYGDEKELRLNRKQKMFLALSQEREERESGSKDTKLLGFLQTTFGGSTDNLEWIEPKNKVIWSSEQEKEFKERTFIDTVIIAVPEKFEVIAGEKPKIEGNIDSKIIKNIFNPLEKKDGSIDANISFHGQVIFNTTSKEAVYQAITTGDCVEIDGNGAGEILEEKQHLIRVIKREQVILGTIEESKKYAQRKYILELAKRYKTLQNKSLKAEKIILKEGLRYTKMGASTRWTPYFIKEGGTFRGYQLYRVGTPNLKLDKVLKVLQGFKDGSYSKEGERIYLVRLDVTTNYKGAVCPYSYNDLKSIHLTGLTPKQNKKYVGECCHSYVVDHTRIIKESKKTILMQAAENVGYTLFGEHKEGDNKRLEIEQERLKAVERGIRYSTFLNIEMSKAENPIEVKIYDKLRFMLETGTAIKKLSGYNLKNLYRSSHKNIEYILKNFHQDGVSRVETRIRGRAIYQDFSSWITSHRIFSEQLINAFSYRTPFQHSIDNFMESIKGCTALSITDTGGNKRYYVAQWINILTGKIQGMDRTCRGSGYSRAEFLNWCNFMSNRNVPLIVIEARDKPEGEKVKGMSFYKDYTIERFTVVPPTSMGYANILEVKQIRTTSNIVDNTTRGFNLKGFRTATINSKHARLDRECTVVETLEDAIKEAVHKRAYYKWLNKEEKTEDKKKSRIEKFTQDKENVAEFFKKPQKLTEGIYEGFVVHYKSKRYFMYIKKSGKYGFISVRKSRKIDSRCYKEYSQLNAHQNTKRISKTLEQRIHVIS